MKKMFGFIVVFVALFGIFIDSETSYASNIPDDYEIPRQIVVPPRSSKSITIYAKSSDEYYVEVGVTPSVQYKSGFGGNVIRLNYFVDDRLEFNERLEAFSVGIFSLAYGNDLTPHLYTITYYNETGIDVQVNDKVFVKYHPRK